MSEIKQYSIPKPFRDVNKKRLFAPGCGFSCQKGICMKKFFNILGFLFLFPFFVFSLAAPVASLFSVKYPRYEKHTDDYPVIYADELEEIFGSYSLGPLREEHMESEDGHLVRDSYEWQITYHDACGRKIECSLNNYETLPVQQLRWLRKQIGEYFCTEYVIRFFDGLVQQDKHKTYCYCRVGRICRSWSTNSPESRSAYDICCDYEDRLMESEPPIPLYKLSYTDILERYPVTLSIHITLMDSVYGQDSWKQKAGRLLQLMGSQAAKDFSGLLNLDAHIVRSSFEDKETLSYTCVMGRETETDFFLDYEYAVFEAYKGKFW